VFESASLWDFAPPEWRGGHQDFPADRQGWPLVDALLDLERLDAHLVADGLDSQQAPRQAVAPMGLAARPLSSLAAERNEKEKDGEDALGEPALAEGADPIRGQLRQLAAIFAQQLVAAARAAAPAGSSRPAAVEPARAAPMQSVQRAPWLAQAVPAALGCEDLLKMILTAMVSQELRRSPNRGTGGGFFEDEEEPRGQAEQDRTTEAFARYTAGKAATMGRAGEVLELYRGQVKEELAIRASDRWSLRVWWKTRLVDECRSVRRPGFLFANMMDTACDARNTEGGADSQTRICCIWSSTVNNPADHPSRPGHAEGWHDGQDENGGASFSLDMPKDAKGQGKRGKWKEAAAGAGGGGPAATPK
jgi:hypothetical protein